MAPTKYYFSQFLRGERETWAYFSKFTPKRWRQGEEKNNYTLFWDTPEITHYFFLWACHNLKRLSKSSLRAHQCVISVEWFHSPDLSFLICKIVEMIYSINPFERTALDPVCKLLHSVPSWYIVIKWKYFLMNWITLNVFPIFIRCLIMKVLFHKVMDHLSLAGPRETEIHCSSMLEKRPPIGVYC